MKKNFFLHSLPFRLLVGVAFGICIGLLLNIIDESAITTAVLNVVVTSKYILGQLISFSVPLIIIGFIAPSITRLGNNASRMLGVAVSIAYASSLGAALFSALSGYLLIPHLSFSSTASHLKALPDVVFELSIPQKCLEESPVSHRRRRSLKSSGDQKPYKRRGAVRTDSSAWSSVHFFPAWRPGPG